MASQNELRYLCPSKFKKKLMGVKGRLLLHRNFPTLAPLSQIKLLEFQNDMILSILIKLAQALHFVGGVAWYDPSGPVASFIPDTQTDRQKYTHKHTNTHTHTRA